jgi:hypothetical protein
MRSSAEPALVPRPRQHLWLIRTKPGAIRQDKPNPRTVSARSIIGETMFKFIVIVWGTIVGTIWAGIILAVIVTPTAAQQAEKAKNRKDGCNMVNAVVPILADCNNPKSLVGPISAGDCIVMANIKYVARHMHNSGSSSPGIRDDKRIKVGCFMLALGNDEQAATAAALKYR